jgi:predicted nucleotidyltransferase
VTIHPFDPGRILGSLAAHEVRFVVIGGIAGRLLGSPTVTNDLDICHAADTGNLERLSAALTELKARLRGVDDAVPWAPTAEMLAAADSFTLTTAAGNLDVLARPAGVSGYNQLAATATAMDVAGLAVLVADIEDLIRMKRAAGRPKDLIEVEVLGALIDERND